MSFNENLYIIHLLKKYADINGTAVKVHYYSISLRQEFQHFQAYSTAIFFVDVHFVSLKLIGFGY